MLKNDIKIIHTKSSPTRRDLNIEKATYDNGVVTLYSESHGLYAGDTICLKRTLDDGYFFYEKFYVNKVNNKDSFNIVYSLENYEINPSSITYEDYITYPGKSESFLCMDFELSDMHIFSNNLGILHISDMYPNDYSFGERHTKCIKTTYSIFDYYFCYGSDYNDIDGNRVFNLPIVNRTGDIIWFSDLSGNTRVVGETLVPFSLNGYHNRQKLFIKQLDADVILTDGTYYCNDCRFFKVGYKEEISGEIEIEDGTEIYSYSLSLNVNIPLSSDFSLDLTKEEDLISYVNEYKNKKVNNIIDYEKQMFSPVRINNSESVVTEGYTFDDSDLSNVSSIRFNIYLRDRVYNENTNEWLSDDNLYWASSISGNTGFTEYQYGDLLGTMGFSDNDVYNQNKRLSKTFLRLSFYDTKSRATQKLLYYATIFINGPKQYAKYMRNVASEIKTGSINTKIITNDENGVEVTGETTVEGYVSTNNSDDNLALCCNFSCYDKYNMSGSSEGYYLYLYPDIVTGTTVSTAYMKVEFNSARYGVTIPLIHPMSGDTETYPPTDYQGIMSGYTGIQEYETKYTDLSSLYDDMYIKVMLKYDASHNRYVWFLPYYTETSSIKLNLYEPRIIYSENMENKWKQ